jgi:hypothetical protein
MRKYGADMFIKEIGKMRGNIFLTAKIPKQSKTSIVIPTLKRVKTA